MHHQTADTVVSTSPFVSDDRCRDLHSPSHSGAWRLAPLALATLALLGCGGGGGGGGGGDRTPPRLVSAFYLSAGATPVAGEVLRLFFDEDVAVAAGTLLSDADFALSAGTSLGAVTTAPAVLDSRTLAVTLGTGVSITPNVSTIALAAANDAVIDTAGNAGRDGTAVAMTRGDAEPPVIGRFTLNGIDAQLNGTGAAGGLLQVPTTGFTIDLAYSDTTSAVDPAQTLLQANVTVTASGQPLTPGTNLLPSLTATTATGSNGTTPCRARWPSRPATSRSRPGCATPAGACRPPRRSRCARSRSPTTCARSRPASTPAKSGSSTPAATSSPIR
jgi:hypothetical protein